MQVPDPKELPSIEEADKITDAVEQARIGDAHYTQVKRGLTRFREGAIQWHTKAADQGHIPSLEFLGKLYEGYPDNLTLAVDWHTKAARQGSIPAQLSLGKIYSRGGKGLLKDMEKSKKWYAEAAGQFLQKASQGDVDAQFTTAQNYKQGKGVEANKKEAIKWFLEAAMNGHPKAQFETSQAYLLGRGTEKDMVKSCAWLEVARYFGFNFATTHRSSSLTEAQKAEVQSLSKELVGKIQTQNKTQ